MAGSTNSASMSSLLGIEGGHMASVSVLILSFTDVVAEISLGKTDRSSFYDPPAMVVTPATLFDITFAVISPAK